MRARTHERHVSHQNIEKLRQFIDARATQETPHPGDAWIIAAGLGNGPAAFVDTNVIGTLSLLMAARAAWLSGSGVPHRFHHVSTDEVYGTLGPNDPAFSETTAYAPNSPYSASKAASDHLVRAWHHTYGLQVTTSNCSNNYGPYQFPEKLIPLSLINALHGRPLPIYGDGMQIRD